MPSANVLEQKKQVVADLIEKLKKCTGRRHSGLQRSYR